MKLDLPDFSRLKNDPISHNPSWLVIPTKIPSYIPKFDGNMGQYPSTHNMTYHLWCSSKSLMDDSLRLSIFQRYLTKSVAKWYVELQGTSFKSFNDLAMVFLTHYQLPVWYMIVMDLLKSLHQDTATHIFDHIHEW
jgi:hypothetical protein